MLNQFVELYQRPPIELIPAGNKEMPGVIHHAENLGNRFESLPYQIREKASGYVLEQLGELIGKTYDSSLQGVEYANQFHD
ncbi:hypothetical protein HOC01_05250 [archaeon]|jgi:hypothetical protein|nr:hypothetical protein [archaeon]MBT6698217.1 hypothetical protein [archaeon]